MRFVACREASAEMMIVTTISARNAGMSCITMPNTFCCVPETRNTVPSSKSKAR